VIAFRRFDPEQEVEAGRLQNVVVPGRPVEGHVELG